MAIVTLEDLQGTIEVVVFPRLYEQTMGDLARRRDPAGRRPRRPQGRGGRRCWPTSPWTGTPPRPPGPEAFARQVAAGDRGGGGRRGNGPNGAGSGGDTATRRDRAPSRRSPVRSSRSAPGSRSGPVGAGVGGRSPRTGRRRPAIPYVSPRRAGAAAVASRPADVLPADRAGRTRLGLPGHAGRRRTRVPTSDDEPVGPGRGARPDRGRRRRPTPRSMPVRETILHVRFAGIGRARSRRRRDGDVQGGRCATARVRRAWSSTCPRRGRRRTAHGAAPGRRLRRRAAGRGPPAAR